MQKYNTNYKLIYTSSYDSPIGKIVIISDGINLLGLYFKDRQIFHHSLDLKIKDNIQVFIDTKKWLDRYFKKEQTNILDLPLLPIGSSFRNLVWDYLCKIPYGDLRTYGDVANYIAKKLNKPKMSSQAVGNAISKNPISIIIPCHRVIGANNILKGYSAGIDIKQYLLKLEGHDIINFK